MTELVNSSRGEYRKGKIELAHLHSLFFFFLIVSNILKPK